MKRILVCGAGGFIGHHLVEKLKSQGNFVAGADLKYPEFSKTSANEFFILDLRKYNDTLSLMKMEFDEVYQLAANMGGAGYIAVGNNDSDIMHDSALINLSVLDAIRKTKTKKVLYTSSACVYPIHNQLDPDNPICNEDSVYPAEPDTEYGWEKLFSERLYLSYYRNYHVDVKIARLHNVFGPQGTWTGGREKAPAAICRKIAESENIEIWGDGNQTRSFLYIDQCIEGLCRLMNSDVNVPINLGSERMIRINELVDIIAKISNKKVSIKYIDGPQGVRGRSSDNKLIKKLLNWRPEENLEEELATTYKWIEKQISK